MGAALVPLLTTAIGMGVTQYNTNQTEKRTKNALNQQLADQDARQKEAQALVDATLNRTSDSDPDAARTTAMDGYLDQLRKTQGLATAGLGQIGAVSDRYTAAAEAANQGIFDTGLRRADQFARIDAPLTQRMNEGIDFGRLSSDLGRVGAKSDTDRFLGTLRMQLASRRNPGLDAAGSLLTSYGSSGGGMGGASTSAASTNQGSIYNFGNNVDAFMGRKKVGYG